MKIGFDATPIAARKSGIGYYAENLLRGLAEDDRIEEILLFSNREPVFDGPLPPHARWIGDRTFPQRAPWLQFILPGLIRRERPDLMHYVNYNAPAIFSHPFVVTFHDMVLFHHPEFFTWKKRILTRSLMPWVARRSRAIVTVSETVRGEILAGLPVAPEKVFAVHNAAGEIFAPAPAAAQAAVRGRHGLSRPYLLFVGTLEPRKNLARVLAAFDAWKRASGQPHQLAVVGGRGWKYHGILEQVEKLQHKTDVCFLDYVPLEEIPALYSAAELFVFPSIYEGFGIPVVEALQCGTPALLSDIPVHHEVAGDAARYCDPLSTTSIETALRDAIDELAHDGAAVAARRQRGLERTARFTWRDSARLTADVYAAVLHNRTGP